MPHDLLWLYSRRQGHISAGSKCCGSASYVILIAVQTVHESTTGLFELMLVAAILSWNIPL